MKFKKGDRVVFKDPAQITAVGTFWYRNRYEVFLVEFVDDSGNVNISFQGADGWDEESFFEFAIEEKLKLL